MSFDPTDARATPEDGLCLHTLFERRSEQAPDEVAVLWKDERLTYEQLNGRANQLARHLRSIGVGAETRVGICVERSPEMVIGLLGILKAGGAYVATDVTSPDARISSFLDETGVAVVVVDAATAPRLAGLRLEAEIVETRAGRNALPTRDLSSVSGPDNLAYVMQTSGSTGRPYAVATSHRASITRLASMWKELPSRPSDVHCHKASLTFVVSVREIFGSLLEGTPLVLLPDDAVKDPRVLTRALRAWGVTRLLAVPALLDALLDSSPNLAAELPALRDWIVDGELVPGSLSERFHKRVPGKVLMNLYGTTEAPGCSYHERDPGPTATVPIGHRLDGVALHLLDERMETAPPGAIGEIYLGGNGLSRGYLNESGTTADRFVPNPFARGTGDRLYRTGDLARQLPGGELELIGRSDEQVKVRGFRVEPREIEVCLRKHPRVEKALVTRDETGPALRRLVAYVVAAADSVDEPDLRHFLGQSLPPYMLPSRFVFLDDFPTTSRGKIDRSALPVARSRPWVGRASKSASTPLETVVSAAWADVLELQDVGVDDEFLDLGGDSLLAVRIVTRLRQALGVDVPAAAVFETGTISRLVRHLDARGTRRREGRTTPRAWRGRVGGSGPVETSFPQERLWFVEQLHPGTSAYNITRAFRVRGHLDLDALERSLTEVVRRHDSLAVVLSERDGRPVQVALPDPRVRLDVVDLRALGYGAEREALRLATQEAGRPFDLNTGPLVRAKCMLVAECDQLLVLSVHHIAIDDWALGIVFSELSVLYRAFAAGEASPLSQPRLTYAEAAAWQRSRLRDGELDDQVAYWKTKLGGARDLLELPSDRPRPALQSLRGSTQRFVVPAAVGAALNELGRREGATLFMTLLAAFDVLLHRYSGQDDIAVGSVIANRNEVELEDLVGFLANTLVLRADLSDDPTFRELLGRVRTTTVEAYDNQDVPFEKVVEELHPERDPSRHPLFQVMFVLQNTRTEGLALAGVTTTPVELDNATSKFDLTLDMAASAEGLAGTVEYDTELFEAATIERLVGHFQNVLEEVARDPDRRLSDLRLLSPAERQQLLAEWNPAPAQQLPRRCVHELFEDQVRRTPEAVAVVFEDRRLTFAELNERANQLAHHLRSLGAGPEVLVGICVERSLEMVVGVLGILKSGAAYVPLDPSYPPARLAFMLRDCRAPLVVTQDHLVAALGPHEARLVRFDSHARDIAAHAVSDPPHLSDADNLCYVIYTSGSTGTPKGVLITHRGVANLFAAQKSRLYDAGGRGRDGQRRIAHAAPLSFDASVDQYLWILDGHTLVILGDDVRKDPELIVSAVRSSGIDVVNLTPTHLKAAIDEGLLDDPARGPHILVIGGEVMDDSLWERLTRTDSVRSFHLYGPTESTVSATGIDLSHRPSKPRSIGSPMPGYRAYVLDRFLSPVPVGVPGQLHIGGSCLARGYLNAAGATVEKFIPDPFDDAGGSRLFATGDLARYLTTGELEFLGRVDVQMKLRGIRIEPAEIEAALAGHPTVARAVVDKRCLASGREVLAAFVVPKDGGEVDTADVRRFLRDKLPDYMLPAVVVPIDKVPVATTGKIDRAALPPLEPSAGEGDGGARPRTVQEETLTRIWTEVLGVDTVGVDDDFFELGGDSLTATQIVSRARKAFGLPKLALRTLFAAPTVAAFAQLLGEVAPSPDGPRPTLHS